MMRRIIDTTIPAGFVVGATPYVLGVYQVPPSLYDSLGQSWARLWLVVMMIVFGATIVGIWLRTIRPALSFTLEFSALLTGGFLSMIYVIVLAPRAAESWLAMGVTWSISMFCLARFAELLLARRHVSRTAE